jgi:hypothetical protein
MLLGEDRGWGPPELDNSLERVLRNYGDETFPYFDNQME